MKRSEWQELHRKLQEQGCTLRMGGSGHWKVYLDGKLITVLPHTTSDWRAIRNKHAELRRLGIVLT